MGERAPLQRLLQKVALRGVGMKRAIDLCHWGKKGPFFGAGEVLSGREQKGHCWRPPERALEALSAREQKGH
jgi:hypothetical protein